MMRRTQPVTVSHLAPEALSPLASAVVSVLDPVGALAIDPKVAAAKAAGVEVFPLKGTPTRPLPRHIKEAVIKAMEEEPSRPSRGLEDLRAAIAAFLKETYGAGVDPGRSILVTNGAMHAVSVLCGALLNPGDQVVMPSPTFFFDGIVRLAGGKPVYVSCDESQGWCWDLDQIAEAIGPRTRMLIACNPGNPTGYVPTRHDMETLVALAKKHDFVLVSDESFECLVYDGTPFTSAATLDSTWRNLVLVRSTSKSYAMSTWRVGYIVAEPLLIDTCLKVLEYQCLYCGYVAQKAAIAAVLGPKDWLADVLAEFTLDRDLAYGAVQSTGVLSCVRTQSGPYLYVNVSRLGEADEVLSDALLFEAGITTIAGRYFQQPGYLRLAFGGAPATIRSMGDALADWVHRTTMPAGG